MHGLWLELVYSTYNAENKSPRFTSHGHFFLNIIKLFVNFGIVKNMCHTNTISLSQSENPQFKLSQKLSLFLSLSSTSRYA